MEPAGSLELPTDRLQNGCTSICALRAMCAGYLLPHLPMSSSVGRQHLKARGQQYLRRYRRGSDASCSCLRIQREGRGLHGLAPPLTIAEDRTWSPWRRIRWCYAPGSNGIRAFKALRRDLFAQRGIDGSDGIRTRLSDLQIGRAPMHLRPMMIAGSVIVRLRLVDT